MANYGIEFGNVNQRGTIAEGFSNYSLVSRRTQFVNAGFNQLHYGATVANPIVMIRHPGIAVGFLQHNGSPSSSSSVWCSAAGTVEIAVFTPNQVRGFNGYGLWIGDSAGREVYHSDLFYLNLTAFAGNGGSISGGFYLLGSRTGYSATFREWGREWWREWLASGTDSRGPWIRYRHHWRYDILMIKRLEAVQHNWDNTLTFTSVVVFDGSVYHTSGAYNRTYDIRHVNVWLGVDNNYTRARQLYYNITISGAVINQSNISSFPNQLLWSDMNYA